MTLAQLTGTDLAYKTESVGVTDMASLPLVATAWRKSSLLLRFPLPRVSPEAAVPHDPGQPALSFDLECELAAGQKYCHLWGVLCNARPHVFELGAQVI